MSIHVDNGTKFINKIIVLNEQACPCTYTLLRNEDVHDRQFTNNLSVLRVLWVLNEYLVIKLHNYYS